MATNKCDSTVKRARFAPISAPTHSQYTPPSSPFLSRSAAEMQNPSPYNSGYESSFSRLPALDTYHLRAETPTLTTKWKDTFVINAWPPSSTPHPRPHSIIFPAPAPKLAISTPSTSTSTVQSQHTTTEWPMTPTPKIQPPHPWQRHGRRRRRRHRHRHRHRHRFTPYPPCRIHSQYSRNIYQPTYHPTHCVAPHGRRRERPTAHLSIRS